MPTLLPRVPRLRRRPTVDDETARLAVRVALQPDLIGSLPPARRNQVETVAKAVVDAAAWTRASGPARPPRPVAVAELAQRAAAALQPSAMITPERIELALRTQGLDWVEPFAPGRPLVPYYGYDRRPRGYDYKVGRNITTETRPDRIPFATLKRLVESYDVANICIRHAINDLRSMSLRFEPVDGVEDDVNREIEAAKQFLRRPDRRRPFSTWLAQHAMDVWRYDAGTLYRQRDRAGRVCALKVIDGTTIAPLVDYFGDIPKPPAPAYQQFIQGIPWDWLTTDDILYQPMWPIPESPYGVAPIEVVLINANTDLRLQQYFLQFFTTGQVPEAFALAPEDQSDPDSLAEWQETWNDWTEGDQAQRWGLRWLPAGTEIVQYKPQQFDADVAEYVMRRTVAAFQMVPHDLGFTDDVNRATGDTQMDTQFRINTLPNAGYYQDLLDSVLQDDLDLPVQVRFDTGREKEDRLMEAQAHQIYVQIGAESPDEVREKVLGHPTNPEELVPRFFDSRRLGPVPLSYLYSVAGDVDPATGAPKAGSVVAREFVLPGAMAPDPLATPGGAPAASDTPTGPHPPAVQTGAPTTNPSEVEHNAPQGTAPNPRAAAGTTSAAATKNEDPVGADLARWRSNARHRVAKGRAPRPFGDSTIPPDIADTIWADLRHADTREAVDEAFAKIAWPVRRPKAERPVRPGPAGHLELRLVAYWTRRILAVLNEHLSGSFLARWALANHPAGVSNPAANAPAAEQITNSIPTRPEALEAAIVDLWADAWQAGAHEADQNLRRAGFAPPLVLSAVDWDHWTPGHASAAALTADEGFANLLADAGVDIAGIDHTTRQRIGDLISRSLAAGDSVNTLAAQIDSVLDNPARAHMIAVTETARAMTAAAVEKYRAGGVGWWDLLNQPDACPTCVATAAANPHPLSDTADLPPLHPNCRCAAAPVVGGAS